MKATVNGHLSHDLSQAKPAACLCCESPLEGNNSRKKFCCGKCRMFYWIMEEIIKEFKAGRANGLRGLIKELSEAAKL